MRGSETGKEEKKDRPAADTDEGGRAEEDFDLKVDRDRKVLGKKASDQKEACQVRKHGIARG